MSKAGRLALGGALAALALWLIFRQVELDELIAALRAANPLWIAAAAAAFFVGYACRIERWRLMLTQDNPRLHWRQCAGPLMASVAVNNVLPFRAGDLLRAFGFNRDLGVGKTTALTVLVVERLLDLLMLIGLLGIALAYFGISLSGLVGIGASLLIATAVLVLLLLLYPTAFAPIASWAVQRLTAVAPALGAYAQTTSGKVFAALGHTASRHVMPRLLLWSMLAWVAEGLVFWWVALALPALTHQLGAWLALALGTLATLIPSTPGYVGTFDYFTALAMRATGNGPAAAAAFAFLVHAVLWLPPTLVGGAYLWSRVLRGTPVRLWQTVGADRDPTD